MDVKMVNDMVAEGNAQLVNTGSFPNDWRIRYESAINEAQVSFVGDVWPKKLFWSFHYVSMHLGLRYQVWRGSSGQSNQESESILHSTQFMTEVFFLAVFGRDAGVENRKNASDRYGHLECCRVRTC